MVIYLKNHTLSHSCEYTQYSQQCRIDVKTSLCGEKQTFQEQGKRFLFLLSRSLKQVNLVLKPTKGLLHWLNHKPDPPFINSYIDSLKLCLTNILNT